MRIRILACDVFRREFYDAAARSIHTVDLEFLPKGLHDLGAERMRERIQACLDVPTSCERILLGYGLCNNGLVGLSAPAVPLIVPRAHDCMTLFLGGRKRYEEIFHALPGTYFHTSGWLERGDIREDLRDQTVPHRLGMDQTFEQLVEAYGEDNARFLQEEFAKADRHYGRFAYIHMGLEPDRFEDQSREKARQKGWEFLHLKGNPELIRRLTDGPWEDSDFLTVPPGRHICASHDDRILALAPA
ncbi:MAG: DUF1638 domain-containing protein [Kiritimatiellia bacterium]|nr:DUF1638 domain-containing protein [Kiritimatiellia bacterium]